MKTAHFKNNINCGNCVAAVTPFLNRIDSIESWKVDLDNPDKILEALLEDDNEEIILKAVRAAGYTIKKVSD